MRISAIIFLMAFVFTADICAQRIIAFDKRGKVKRVKYYEGDYIKLKLSSGLISSGSIDKIFESSFSVNGQIIQLDSVVNVFNTQKFIGFKIIGNFFTTAGVAYFSIDSFNRLINRDSPVISKSNLIVSSALLGIGLINNQIANKSYKISPKRPLKIIDLTI